MCNISPTFILKKDSFRVNLESADAESLQREPICIPVVGNLRDHVRDLQFGLKM